MKKIYLSIAAGIIIIMLIYLPLTMKYVNGIAGDANGNFVIGVSLMNSENRHDLFFYNSKCLLINKITIYKRGGITIGSYNDYLVVQDGLGENETYDFLGNKTLKTIYTEALTPKYFYYGNNNAISYKKDIFGNEYVYYRKNNKTTNVDFNYKFYRNIKIEKMIFQVVIVVFLILTFQLVKKKLYTKSIHLKCDANKD